MLAQFLLYDGFDPLDVLAPYEILTAGGDLSGTGLRTELVSVEGAREVPSGIAGISLRAGATLEPGRAGLVLVPGAAGGLPGADPALADVPTLLARALETGLAGPLGEAVRRPEVTVAAVCGGSLVLAMAGLVRGRPLTTHQLGLAGLAEAGAIPVRARVVDDGDLISAGGVTSGLDLGLYLLERELGPRIAHQVERFFEHERRGVVWRDTGLTPALAGVNHAEIR